LIKLVAIAVLVSLAGQTPELRTTSVRLSPPPQAEAVAALRLAQFPQEATSSMRFAPIATDRVQRLLKKRNQAGLLQIGIPRDLATESDSNATPRFNWIRSADGSEVARMEVTSPEAHALRVGIHIGDLPVGTELRFLGSADTKRIVGVVTAAQVKASLVANAVYWTPHTDGETQTIEWYVPDANAAKQLRVRVVGASHIVTSALEHFSLAKALCGSPGAGGPNEGCAASCERDVACTQNPSQQLQDVFSAVVQTEVVTDAGAVGLCTGTLLADTVHSLTPYLYSSNHCLGGQPSNANTLNTFWFFQNAACGGNIALPSSFTQRMNGADILYGDQPSDVLLYRLRDTPPAGATFAGWDATRVATGTEMIVVHHPAGDVKKISQGVAFGKQDSDNAPNIGLTVRDLYLVSFTSGITESGSSGAGLITRDGSGDYFLRGGLYGGEAGLTCSAVGQSPENGNAAAFSRFDRAFPHLQPFLSPNSSSGFLITPGITGNWFDPDQNGHGFSIEILPGNYMLAQWYVFAPLGGATWIEGTGQINGDTAVLQGFQAEGSGGMFPPLFNPAQVHTQAWGSMTFRFSDCNHGVASWQPTAAGYTSGSMPIQRLTQIAGLACP